MYAKTLFTIAVVSLIIMTMVNGALDDYKLFLDVCQGQSLNSSNSNIAVSPMLLNETVSIIEKPLNRTCVPISNTSSWLSYIIILYDEQTFKFETCESDKNTTEFLNVKDDKVKELMMRHDLENVSLATISLISFEDIWTTHFKLFKYGNAFWSSRRGDYTFPQAVGTLGVYPFFENDHLKCIRIPIQNNLLIEMIFPKEPIVNITLTLERVIGSYDQIMTSLKPTEVYVRVPRFRFTNFLDLDKATTEHSLDGIIQILNFEPNLPLEYIRNGTDNIDERLKTFILDNPFILSLYSADLNQCLLICAITDPYYGS